jgi:hypothetical protein
MTSTEKPEKKDDWSTPVSDDAAADAPDSPIDDSAGATKARSPEAPPVDDAREHPADFAPKGYDDRQEDAVPRARRESPGETAATD